MNISLRRGVARLLRFTSLLAINGGAFQAAAADWPLAKPLSLPPAIEASRDVAFAGIIGLKVDATDVARRVFSVEETIPVIRAGPMTLIYPKWLPGNHAPTGPLRQLAGLEIYGDGKRIEWTRDAVEMYAFHIDVPAGVHELKIKMQAITPQRGNFDVVMSSEMLALDWNTVLLYPAGYFARDIRVSPQLHVPTGWQFATALDGAVRKGSIIDFAPAALDTIVDSPVVAGRHYRLIELSRTPVPVRLNLFADKDPDLAASASQVDALKNLVTQAYSLFGSHHFDHYDGLMWLSGELGGKGLEHLRSSEDGTGPTYFTDAPGHIWIADLLPHEFAHSWNGKFRRPADLWTPDFHTPMRTSLLWVYEGQTNYWGQVLAARSGLATRQNALDQLAQIAAMVDLQTGREWRTLADTTNMPVYAYRTSPVWQDWQRGDEYYVEGLLIWLDADTLIRERTHGQKSLDDFARTFFGTRSDSMIVDTYTFEDVVAALNVVAPYDWRAFLLARLNGHGPGAPLDGLRRGGYGLVYSDIPTEFFRSLEVRDHASDLTYSVGMIVTEKGEIRTTAWHGVADKAGLLRDDTILAVNGQIFEPKRLTDAITAARKTGSIDLTVRSGDDVRLVTLRYGGGLRYPRLARLPGTSDWLSKIYAPRNEH